MNNQKLSKNKRKQVISCGTVPFRGQVDIEILLVRPFEELDVWGIPKGHLHPGETHEDCAIRETLEETGLLVKPLQRLIDVRTRYRDEEKTVVSFLAEQVCNNVPTPQTSELVDVRWFNIKNLPTVHTYQMSLIEHVLSVLKNSV